MKKCNCEKCLTDVNPRYVLRNWMAESAIRKAEMNDFSEVCVLYLITFLYKVLWQGV